MDLGLRNRALAPLTRNTLNFKNNPSRTSNTPNEAQNREPASNFDKYARKPKTNNTPGNPTQPVTTDTPSATQTGLRSSINRYYRSDSAPKNQFKHYLSDSNNIFYQQRPALRRSQRYHRLQFITGSLLLTLMLFYLALYFVRPFPGICPHNAHCGVFVHCYQGFKHDPARNECVLSQDLYDQIESVCTDRVVRAREDWGEQECQGKDEVIPKIYLEELLEGIDNYELRSQLEHRLEEFLAEADNQEAHRFEYYRTAKMIVPTEKKYLMFCYLSKLTSTTTFKISLPFFLLGAVGVLYALVEIRKNIIAKSIYKQLRKRTKAEQMLNISYAKVDLEKQFGPIDQGLWERVDRLRTKDRDIGFLQDDFLYWKML